MGLFLAKTLRRTRRVPPENTISQNKLRRACRQRLSAEPFYRHFAATLTIARHGCSGRYDLRVRWLTWRGKWIRLKKCAIQALT
eukprot:3694385-Amphidinium_carterae.1